MRDIANIISELQNQKAAIDNALAALREVAGTQVPKRRGHPPGKRAGTGAPTHAPAKRGQPAKKQARITEEGRQRLAEAMKKRWAAKRAAKKATKRAATKKQQS